jgi:hypothetical protein
MNQLPVLKQENKQDHQPAKNLLIPVKQMETGQSYKFYLKSLHSLLHSATDFVFLGSLTKSHSSGSQQGLFLLDL